VHGGRHDENRPAPVQYVTPCTTKSALPAARLQQDTATQPTTAAPNAKIKGMKLSTN